MQVTPPKDWKTFLIRNKWAPARLIERLYPDFNPRYDLANWTKTPRVKQLLNREYWSPSLKMEEDQAEEVLRAIFKYYFEEDLGIDFNSADAAYQLISHSWDREHELYVYTSSSYLALTKGDHVAWRKRVTLTPLSLHTTYILECNGALRGRSCLKCSTSQRTTR